jgi:glycine C-acetyltransferase
VPLASAPDTTVRVRAPRPQDAPELLNLSSYNYLGMSTSPIAKAAAMAAIERYGLGASGGPILSGMFDVHRELEAEIARCKKKEACTLFPTGCAANIGIWSAIARPGNHLFLDQYSHASLVDGAILSRAKTLFFRHNNERDLERKLAGVTGRKLVVVEVVYPEAYARSRFFSGTLPPAVSAGVLASLRHVEAHPELRNSLKENVAFTRATA